MRNIKKYFCIAVILCILMQMPCFVFAEEIDQPLGNMTITVGTAPRQTFNAFGFGMNNQGKHSDPAAQNELYKLVYDDLGTKSVRLWFAVDKYAISQGEYNLDAFKTKYGIGNSGVIENAKAHGVTEFLLAPTSLPAWMRGEVASDITGAIKANGLLPEYAKEYGETLARAIYELKTNDNIDITATGIYNELDSVMWERETYEAVKACRTKLDGYGLQNVKIIAPELANNDSRAISHFNYAVGDTEAWNDLYGFSTHSYNMAPNKAVADLLAANPKPFWQTESSTVGPEDAGNYENAATTAARMMNDFNHMVTDWFYFIGYLGNDPKDNGTRLIITYPDQTSGVGYLITEKYYFIKHILKTFDVGAQMRLCTSDKEGEMNYTYGRKGKIYSASGVNPDGTWSVGILNNTNTDFANRWLSSDNTFYQQNAIRPSQPFDVTINMTGLAKSGSQVFNIVRSGPGGVRIQTGETAVFINGKATVRVNPFELVTLRSVNAIEETVPELSYKYDESFNEFEPDTNLLQSGWSEVNSKSAGDSLSVIDENGNKRLKYYDCADNGEPSQFTVKKALDCDLTGKIRVKFKMKVNTSANGKRIKFKDRDITSTNPLSNVGSQNTANQLFYIGQWGGYLKGPADFGAIPWTNSSDWFEFDISMNLTGTSTGNTADFIITKNGGIPVKTAQNAAIGGTGKLRSIVIDTDYSKPTETAYIDDIYVEQLPPVQGEALGADNTAAMKSPTQIDENNNTITLNMKTGTPKNGLLEAGDYKIINLPDGITVSGAIGNSAEKTIKFTFAGEAAENVTENVLIQFVINYSAVTETNLNSSLPISGGSLLPCFQIDVPVKPLDMPEDEYQLWLQGSSYTPQGEGYITYASPKLTYVSETAMSVQLNIINIGDSLKNPVITVGQYCDGKLYDYCVTREDVLPNGSRYFVSKEFERVQNGRIKVFVWRDLVNLYSHTECLELSY